MAPVLSAVSRRLGHSRGLTPLPPSHVGLAAPRHSPPGIAMAPSRYGHGHPEGHPQGVWVSRFLAVRTGWGATGYKGARADGGRARGLGGERPPRLRGLRSVAGRLPLSTAASPPPRCSPGPPAKQLAEAPGERLSWRQRASAGLKCSDDPTFANRNDSTVIALGIEIHHVLGYLSDHKTRSA